MRFGGRQYVASPYDGRQRALKLQKLTQASQLTALAANDGRLTARVLAQSVSHETMAAWLGMVDVHHAVRVLRDSAMTYDAQSQRDAAAVGELLDRGKTSSKHR
jgi:hypothetical protein